MMYVSNMHERNQIKIRSLIVSSFFLIMGSICIIVKGITVRYPYDEHLARDTKYLIPIGYSLMGICVLILIIGSIKIRILIKRERERTSGKKSD